MSCEFLSRRQLFGCTGALVLTAVVPGLARSADQRCFERCRRRRRSAAPASGSSQRTMGRAVLEQRRQAVYLRSIPRPSTGQHHATDKSSAPSSGPSRLQSALPTRYTRASSGHGAQFPGRARSLQPEQSVSASAGRSGTRSRRLRQRRRDAPMSLFSSFFPQA